MKKPIGFISGPFTEGDQFVNVRNAVLAAMQLEGLGILPMCPHLWAFWHFLKPEPYSFWMEMCLDWIPHCDFVLRLPGESPGADRETEEAKLHSIPVFYSIREVVEWIKENAIGP